MKKFILLAALAFLLLPATAQAHVLLQDEARKMGAMLHITPDDDPIAGEPSSLVFDIQNSAITENTHSFTLSVTEADGASEIIPITPSGSTISAQYIFPRQALYTIGLQAEPLDTTQSLLSFTHTQRVARGLTSTTSQVSHTTAEVGLIAGSCAFLFLGIIVWNRREDIARHVKQSTPKGIKRCKT